MEQPLSPELQCRRCGEVIGVYEPLVAVHGGHPHHTSRAAAPWIREGDALCFHRSCFEQGDGEPSDG